VSLTEANSDGENGVRLVKKMGGRVIAQDEETSECFSMPSAAIKSGAIDLISPLHQIAPKLISLLGG
jgi:two-component system chemotaxis response regulator CheB